MATTTRSRRAALVLGACAACAAGGVATVQASNETQREAKPAPVNAMLAAKFATFRSPQAGRGDTLKKAVLDQGVQADGRTSVPEIDFDRAAATPIRKGLTGWLTPAGDNVCLVLEAGGTTSATACTDPARASEGAATLLQVFPGQDGGEQSAVLLTAVPDGAASPAIRNGKAVRHAVIDGNISKAILRKGDVVDFGHGRTVDVSLILDRDQGLHAPRGFPMTP